MTLKTKLITSVSMFFLVVALLVVGVWAVSTAQVTMGGTISFNATNIYATITGTIEGATNAKAMTPLEYSAKTEPNDTAKATWCQDLTFADATIPTIKWTITIENKSERALYVTLADNITSLSNATKTLTFDGGSADGEQTIPAKTSKVFTMEIKVDDTNTSAIVNYDFDFDLRDETAPEAQGFTVTIDYSGSMVVFYKINEMTEFVSCEYVVMSFKLENVYQIELKPSSGNVAEVTSNPNVYSGHIGEGPGILQTSTGMIIIEQDTTFTMIQ